MTIVDLSRLRIEAEVDEFDIAGVAVGAHATILAEGYSGRRWDGQVEEVPLAVVSRQTRPDDPGRPADTRVLHVKVAFREANPLKLGQRVEVEIVRGNRKPWWATDLDSAEADRSGMVITELATTPSSDY
jgi:HlyD family secretion protein